MTLILSWPTGLRYPSNRQSGLTQPCIDAITFAAYSEFPEATWRL